MHHFTDSAGNSENYFVLFCSSFPSDHVFTGTLIQTVGNTALGEHFLHDHKERHRTWKQDDPVGTVKPGLHGSDAQQQ